MSVVRRCSKSPAFWIGTCLLGAGIASNLGAIDSGSSIAPGQASEAEVMREGTRIDGRPGKVRQEADRLAVLFADDDRPLIALENLATQRMMQAVLDDPLDQDWIITGSITEYQGRNFILLERVARSSK